MNSTYIILDFETTGFSAELDRVIEIGAVKVCAGKVIDTFQTLVDPEREIPYQITRVTGITNAMIVGAPMAEIAMRELGQFVGNAPIVAHNAQFDSRFFIASMKRALLPAENEFVCTMKIAKKMLPDLKAYKLQTLCDHYGIVNKSAHRALADVNATYEVFINLCGAITAQSGMSDFDARFLQELSVADKGELEKLLSPVISMF